jgi:hypothetical protein
VHILDVEGDVLLRLPLDLLVELGGVIIGTVILRMITACPLMLSATSRCLILPSVNALLRASTTAGMLKTCPSTMV